MTESILKATLRLFAMVAQLHTQDELPIVRNVIRSYLRQLVNPEKQDQYIIIYDFYLSGLKKKESNFDKLLSVLSIKSLIICEQINKTLLQKQKALIVVQLFEILNLKDQITDKELDFLKTLIIALKFDERTYLLLKNFILVSNERMLNSEFVIVADGEESEEKTDNHILVRYLRGTLVFLHLELTNTVLFRHIKFDDNLYLNGRKVMLDRTYMLERGASIRSPIIGAIYYSDIIKKFRESRHLGGIKFVVDKLSFKFPGSDNGIHEFSLDEDSGQLIGIMGGSGVGKSTLLNLLNGNIVPNSGSILINGYNVHTNRNQLEGIIGYIPQDDLLIDELTVWQNLYYSTKLCYRDLSDKEIADLVSQTLTHLGLYEIKDMVVGNPLNKFISGGQRKRLNIALELIREPWVLFVDEPTSGLSSTDSLMVMDLLKEQAHKGKLLFINIHQPSSDIFKLLDKLVIMDKGGRIVYQGNPIDAPVYFKQQNQLINAEDSECLVCGNVNPEQILEILEANKIDESGHFTEKRQIEPETWYHYFKKNIEKEVHPENIIKLDLPKRLFRVPTLWKQFKLYSVRNFLTKIFDRQYILINLLEAPILAMILGFFTRYNAGNAASENAYIFSENINIPVYIFMSVIVALFLGMMVSAEEIIKDKKILVRESFLNLSKFSYYNSKILLLFSLSAMQTFLFVIIGNHILEIKHMGLAYWLMLFSVAVFSNMLGLNISASFKSVVSIYILIPLLLVPQILLGGAMIRFDKMNKKITSQDYVPFIGNIMTSRWAYEALAVYQFSENKYQRHLFDVERKESELAYKLNYYIPELESGLKNIIYSQNKDIPNKVFATDVIILHNELYTLFKELGIDELALLNGLQINMLSTKAAEQALVILNRIRAYYAINLEAIIEKKDILINKLAVDYDGMSNLLRLKQTYHNNNLEDLVLNKQETKKIEKYKGKLIQKSDPIYKQSSYLSGRAHMFAPEKRLGQFTINTYWFNLGVIWGMIIFLYLFLIFELIKKITNFSYLLVRKIGYLMKTK